MSENVLVTVYIPTYNRLTLLKRAVDSVLSQIYKNIEVIVVDDCSTDGTKNYLESLCDSDRRVKYLINAENSGGCYSRNRAIYAASGDYITGLDDDDYFLANHISSLVNAWQENNDNIIALYSENFVKQSDGLKKIRAKPKSCSSQDLLCSNWIGNQVFTKVEFLREISGFDAKFPAWQDLECWYRLLKSSGKMAVCTKEYTCVVDESHPHERISSSGTIKVEKACQLFEKKHNLSKKESKVLSLMLIPYGVPNISLKPVVTKIMIMPSYKNLRNAIALLYIDMKKRYLQ